MIEIMNEQQIEFANIICRFSFPRLDVNLFDDGASFFILESGLEEVLTLS